MRHFILILVASLLLVFTLSACSKSPAAPAQVSDDTLDERARTFVRFMAEAKYDDAVKMMESKMVAVFPADKAKQAWETLVAQVGAFDSVSGTRLAAESGFRSVYVTCKFKEPEFDSP